MEIVNDSSDISESCINLSENMIDYESLFFFTPKHYKVQPSNSFHYQYHQCHYSNFLNKQFIHLSCNLFQRMERLSYSSTNALEKKWKGSNVKQKVTTKQQSQILRGNGVQHSLFQRIKFIKPHIKTTVRTRHSESIPILLTHSKYSSTKPNKVQAPT